MNQVIVEGAGGLGQRITAREHQFRADEPVADGGSDTGPTPYELLLGSLGACTAITLRLYAQRKGWPLEDVSITLDHDRVHAQDSVDCETQDARIDRITKHLKLVGPLTDAQRDRLAEIADRCPVRRTLSGQIHFQQTVEAVPSHD